MQPLKGPPEGVDVARSFLVSGGLTEKCMYILLFIYNEHGARVKCCEKVTLKG
jgi:hypothetical protein